MSINISKTARSYPKLNYLKIKDYVLGEDYNLSLVFYGATNAQRLNKNTRNKDYTPNVLSFPLDKHNGEIYITPAVAKKEAHKFNLSYSAYIGFLFIHGLLHLKKYKHGENMEKEEQRLMKKFGLNSV